MTHYVDNQVLHQELMAYTAKLKHASANNLPEPKANNFIGKAIIDIADGLAMKSCYRQYTWLDEMKGQAIIQMTQAIKKYNPEKSTNPHAFLTRTAIWAFHATLAKENQMVARRNESIADVTVDYFQQGLDGTQYHIPREDVIAMMNPT